MSARSSKGRLKAAALLFAALVCVLPADSAPAPGEIVIRPPATGAPPDAASRAIEQALARARGLKQSRPGRSVTVRFAPGLYRLARPIQLRAEDSGAQAAPLRLVADGMVRLSGARILPLAPARPGDGTPALPPPAVSHVRVASLGIDRVPFFAPRGNASPVHPESVLLIQNGVALHAARWPRAGYRKADPQSAQPGPRVSPVFQAPAEKAAQWAREPDLWAGGYWTYDWAFETEPVRAIDEFSNDIRIAPLATDFAQAETLRYFVFNAFSEIRAPGDFAVSPAGRLAVWPHPGAPVESAELETVLRISGAHDIAVSGFVIEGALGDAVVIEHASRVVLADGLVRNTGGNGVVVVGGDHDRIERMVVTDTGENGVSLTGGDRRTLAAGGHVVADSIITRFARLTRTYRAAVLLQGVGNSVTGSYLAHGPHMAVLYSGNDHVISGNEMTDVVLETGDAGVIYAGRDVFSRGTLITRNYMHHIGGDSGLDVRGVYLDDFLGGNLVRGNLFVDMRLPVFLNSGSANQVSGNIFVRPAGAAVTVRDSADTWDVFQGDLYRNARPALGAQALYRERYGEAAMAFRQPRPLRNRIGPNMIFGRLAFGTDHGAAASDQDVTDSIHLPARQLRGTSLPDIAIAVERSAVAAAYPFPFTSADRKAALKGLRYAARALR